MSANAVARLTRANNTEKRNQKIRDAFYTRYTNQPRPRKFAREHVVSQLAEEFFLSAATVEDILYAGVK